MGFIASGRDGVSRLSKQRREPAPQAHVKPDYCYCIGSCCGRATLGYFLRSEAIKSGLASFKGAFTQTMATVQQIKLS